MLTATRFMAFTLIWSVLGMVAPQVVTTAPSARNVQTPIVERVVHLAPPAATASRYAYIPFDVPPHAVRISISYHYEHANGANTIDIGLFDARSTNSDADPQGFRGWSGGRRSEFFISGDQATPGYLPGELPAGTWRIILGLYRIAPAGVDVSFKIKIETEENRSSTPAPASRGTGPSSARATTISQAEGGTRTLSPQKVARRGLRWWRGDLHMHTVHSDGT